MSPFLLLVCPYLTSRARGLAGMTGRIGACERLPLHAARGRTRHVLAAGESRCSGQWGRRAERRRSAWTGPRRGYAVGVLESFMPGMLAIRARASRHACWTIQDSDRSCLIASCWISCSMSSGKYSDCFRLSFRSTMTCCTRCALRGEARLACAQATEAGSPRRRRLRATLDASLRRRESPASRRPGSLCHRR
jgi:hypothetical protein